MSRIFVLGAPDPEMDAIQALLDEHGERFTFAMVGDHRVHAGNAYTATRTRNEIEPGEHVITIECDVRGLRVSRVIDHHRPGDPGYACSPERYWEGSSYGQLHILMGLEPTDQARIIAAADHCVTAAYASKCPGVDPLALKQWRLQSRAERRGVPLEVMEKNINEAITRLRQLDRTVIAGHEYANAIGHDIPEVPEASAISGIAVMHVYVEPKSQREKVSVLGGTPEAIRAWQAWASTFLADVYGNPNRGYAGGYAP